jgi:hypothetical protein
MIDARVADRINHYQGYRGLPPLVGLLSITEAISKGIPVQEAAERLKRVRWGMRAAVNIFMGHIAPIPIYELKMAFSLHSHYCAEHVEAIATRVREMRQPPYGFDMDPTSELRLLQDEVLCAPSTSALLLGLYEVLFPEIESALRSILADLNKLFEHPTYRVCRFALLEVEEINTYGREALRAMVPAEDRENLRPWLALLQAALAASGGLDGTSESVPAELKSQFSSKPYVYDGTPMRDERFVDPDNMGVNAEAMLFDPEMPPQAKILMLFFKRMREINVPEVMSSIIFETPGKPWPYYRDMIRQLWDEARHAMMGEVGFVSLGLDWTKIPMDVTWSRSLNKMLSPLERHAVLFTIEQGLMPKKVGKEYEWEVALSAESSLSQLIQDYDWADEVLHARIGRQWYVPEIGTQQEALAYGDQRWSRIVHVSWDETRNMGLTEHRNWWPDVYKEACVLLGEEPDPKALAFHVTYQDRRPDQKVVAA